MISLFSSNEYTGLEAVSHDGTDVYFSTFETLVGRDHNGEFVKFYDARTGRRLRRKPGARALRRRRRVSRRRQHPAAAGDDRLRRQRPRRERHNRTRRRKNTNRKTKRHHKRHNHG